MKEKKIFLLRVMPVLLLGVIIFMLFFCRNRQTGRPLACLAMTSADDSFVASVAQELEKQLDACGNKVLLSYCDNDMNLQITQIENYIAMHPAVLVIQCMGDRTAYDKILERTRDDDMQVVVFSSLGSLEHADIQMISSNLGRGICAANMIKSFIQKTEDGTTKHPVKVLLLGNASTESDIMTMAGYQLIGEKYLRYYDMKHLQFYKEDGERVEYTDGYGERHEVEEPTGGLLLDKNGDAILNPYYEPEIQLITAEKYMNIQTNLQGQQAMDAFLGDKENRDIRIVVAASGEAAVGAAGRLEACLARNGLVYPKEKLAVFGVDNTEQNRKLVSQAAKGNGIFRGFVGDYSISREVDNIIRNLLAGRKGTYQCYSFYSGYNAGSDTSGIVVFYDTGVSKLDLFKKGERK
ncbi:MAG: substrate-binding domain-containing protein [Candidatus Copromonas sp.]|nr:substrate-binding domain-containing protein [Candidatus Copromonas sp.]